MESFELAISMGVDTLECDIVPTKDGQLVLRHESDLSDTTDVLEKPEFAGRIHSTELTLAELQTLRAKERVPDWRPGSGRGRSARRCRSPPTPATSGSSTPRTPS